METTFLVQQKLIDDSWYQVHELSFLLTAITYMKRCQAANPDREYRIASRTITITPLELAA